MSQKDRIRKSINDNSFLDTSPGVNADIVFDSVLRKNQRDRSKDLSAESFRFSDNKAERLLNAELSFFNPNRPKGF